MFSCHTSKLGSAIEVIQGRFAALLLALFEHSTIGFCADSQRRERGNGKRNAEQEGAIAAFLMAARLSRSRSQASNAIRLTLDQDCRVWRVVVEFFKPDW